MTGAIAGGLPVRLSACAALVGLLLLTAPAHGETAGERLVAAYPDHLERVDGNDVVWKDGTRMRIDDGAGTKPFERWLAAPDLKDMLAIAYVPGDPAAPPTLNSDPGRARNTAFFAKMYGDCARGEVTRNLVDVVWLPKKAGQKLKVSKINGAAERLAAISRALDDLPASFDTYLKPSEGTYVCRPIAGTTQVSAHGYGIAIDLSTKHAHYWRWSKGGAAAYQNKIPLEIVRIFEANGFIWGGKWWHYDTMHFEYRPELLPVTVAKP
jgi:D-alanyl-D-alanine carboxypeptidase